MYRTDTEKKKKERLWCACRVPAVFQCSNDYNKNYFTIFIHVAVFFLFPLGARLYSRYVCCSTNTFLTNGINEKHLHSNYYSKAKKYPHLCVDTYSLTHTETGELEKQVRNNFSPNSMCECSLSLSLFDHRAKGSFFQWLYNTTTFTSVMVFHIHRHTRELPTLPHRIPSPSSFILIYNYFMFSLFSFFLLLIRSMFSHFDPFRPIQMAVGFGFSFVFVSNEKLI